VHALGLELITRAQGNLPGDVAGAGIDRDQLSPWWLLTWLLVLGIPETAIEGALAEGLKRR